MLYGLNNSLNNKYTAHSNFNSAKNQDKSFTNSESFGNMANIASFMKMISSILG